MELPPLSVKVTTPHETFTQDNAGYLTVQGGVLKVLNQNGTPAFTCAAADVTDLDVRVTGS